MTKHAAIEKDKRVKNPEPEQVVPAPARETPYDRPPVTATPISDAPPGLIKDIPVEYPVIAETPVVRTLSEQAAVLGLPTHVPPEPPSIVPPGPLLAGPVQIAACNIAVQRIACKMYLGFTENDVTRTHEVTPWHDLTIAEQSNWCAAAVAALPNLNQA